jgi:hypothetical protein
MTDAPTRLVLDGSGASRPSDDAIAAIEEDALNLMRAGAGDEAMLVMQAVRDAREIPEKEQLVELDEDELAQRAVDVAAYEDTVAADRARALQQLRARRDRWLAQTDVFALPPEAYPVDMPQAVKDSLVANRKAWTTFRQALRAYPSTVEDPLDPPPFPEQPAQPSIVLS